MKRLKTTKETKGNDRNNKTQSKKSTLKTKSPISGRSQHKNYNRQVSTHYHSVSLQPTFATHVLNSNN